MAIEVKSIGKSPQVEEFDLIVSVVLYNTKASEIIGLVSILCKQPLKMKIVFIDNSEDNALKHIKELDPMIEYIHTKKNVGYGTAHNIGIFEVFGRSKYHLIINSDVEFDSNVLISMFQFMEKHPDVGCVVPKVLYSNGTEQHLVKLYPTPFDLIIRRFLPFNLGNHFQRVRSYELRHLTNKTCKIPIGSGCFMFCRRDILTKVNGFDPRFFLYMEDTDLCRRINMVSSIVHFPDVEVVHLYSKGSYDNLKLMINHIISAIKYFNKWGWFFDKERVAINRKYLNKSENIDLKICTEL